MDGYTFLLRGSGRRVTVPSDAVLATLSEAIFAEVGGFGDLGEGHDDHAHSFGISEDQVVLSHPWDGDERATGEVRLSELGLVVDQSIAYTWDLGETWQVPLVVKAVP